MPKPLTHEDISTQFLESGALNFEAIGQFVTRIGPELVTRDEGLHGVLYGRFNTLACVMRADDLQGVFHRLRAASGLSEAMGLPEA